LLVREIAEEKKDADADTDDDQREEKKLRNQQ